MSKVAEGLYVIRLDEQHKEDTQVSDLINDIFEKEKAFINEGFLLLYGITEMQFQAIEILLDGYGILTLEATPSD